MQLGRLQKRTAHFKKRLVHWSSGPQTGPQRPPIQNWLAFTFRIFSATPTLEGIWRLTTTLYQPSNPVICFSKSLSEKPSTMPWCCSCEKQRISGLQSRRRRTSGNPKARTWEMNRSCVSMGGYQQEFGFNLQELGVSARIASFNFKIGDFTC